MDYGLGYKILKLKGSGVHTCRCSVMCPSFVVFERKREWQFDVLHFYSVVSHFSERPECPICGQLIPGDLQDVVLNSQMNQHVDFHTARL